MWIRSAHYGIAPNTGKDGPEKADYDRSEVVGSDSQDHYLGRLDEGGDGLALLKAHLANGVGGDDGRDSLTTDRDRHLGHQPQGLDIGDAADQLVSSADLAEIVAPFADVAAFGRVIQKLVDLLLGTR